MKKLSFFLLLILTLITCLNVKASEEGPSLSNINPGITPESPLYNLDLFWEDLLLKLTFNKQNKIDKLTNNAKERLAELNKIDPEKSFEWIDRLYDDYGSNLTEANELIAQLVYDGKISSNNLIQYQSKIDETVKFEESIKAERKEKLNIEIVEKVKEVKVDSYLTTMPMSLTQEELNQLKELNVRPGMILKINSLKNLSDYTIEELLELDIYKENKKEKEIDINKLVQALGISKDELVNNLKDYNDVLKEINKEKLNNGKNDEKLNEKLEEIKDKIKENKSENEPKGNRK